MGPGIGILFPAMVAIYVASFALSGLFLSVLVHVLSKAFAGIFPIENLTWSAIKRGGVWGFLFATVFIASLFSDALLHTNVSKYVPLFALAFQIAALLPLSMRCVVNQYKKQSVKLAVAFGLTLLPSIAIQALALAISRHHH